MNEFLDLDDFVTDMGVAWPMVWVSHEEVKKVYSKLDLPLYWLINFSETLARHNSYDDSSNVEGSEAPFRVVP